MAARQGVMRTLLECELRLSAHGCDIETACREGGVIEAEVEEGGAGDRDCGQLEQWHRLWAMFGWFMSACLTMGGKRVALEAALLGGLEDNKVEGFLEEAAFL